MWWRRSGPERVLPTWANGLILLRINRVRSHLKRLHHGIGDLLARLVAPHEQGGRDLQVCGGRGITQRAEHGLPGPQRLTGPSEADRAEHAMRHRVPW
jgi:hypothetical protein